MLNGVLLNPFEDAIDPALIGPADSRVQEIRTTRFPWNTIVHLCRDHGSGQCAGCSGILIDNGRVLTAAHCLWNAARGGPPRRIFVMPGRSDRKTMPYGALPASHWFVPKGFLGPPSARASWDFGLIVLARPVQGIDRFVPLRAQDDAQMRRYLGGEPITIAGYPADRPLGTMWRHSERIVAVDARRLYHTVDTCPGHSGSAILADFGGKPGVIGVHAAGLLDPEGRSYGCKRGSVLAPPGSRNSGVRMLASVVAALREPEMPRAGNARMVRLP